jgi:diguanylate cyclase (GGDEF)-like protein
MADDPSAVKEAEDGPGRGSGGFGRLLDRTQGHLFLRWRTVEGARRLHRIGLPALYCILALGFLIYFAVDGYLAGQKEHARLLVIFSFLVLICYLYLQVSDYTRVTKNTMAFLLGVLCFSLFYTGGIDGTGPLWYSVFPLFAFFVQRLWAGLLSVLVLLAATLFLLWHPVLGFDPSMYTESFRERFISVYIVISIMAFLYAYLRTDVELDMDYIQEKLRDIANLDELTGLPNRRNMRDILAQEINRIIRGTATFSLVFADIDNFKAINDLYGHDCGDAVLKSVPNVMDQVLRKQDVCARWGGEEFLILLPETNLAGAEAVAERLRATFHQYQFGYDGKTIPLTASFGVSEFSAHEPLDGCLKRVDKNLYAAKIGGGNKVVA